MTGIIGSKNAVRHAFNTNLIEDGQVWLDMIKDRNLASHSYDEETAKELVVVIIEKYYCQLALFSEKMDGLE